MAIQVSCCMFLNFTSQPPSIVCVPSLNREQCKQNLKGRHGLDGSVGQEWSHTWPWSLTCRGHRWGYHCWPWQICRGADGCEAHCGCYRCLLWLQDLIGQTSALFYCSNQCVRFALVCWVITTLYEKSFRSLNIPEKWSLLPKTGPSTILSLEYQKANPSPKRSWGAIL